MPFHVVLVHPEIPNNTGNIGRLCFGTGSELHLIKPLGFSLEDKQLKRSGLDYWPKLKVHIHEDFTAFRTSHPKAKMAFYSSKGTQNYWDLETQEDHYFVFGCESKGLPEALLETQQQSLYKIPLATNSIRSFNLANAVSIVLFEGKRQQFFKQK